MMRALQMILCALALQLLYHVHSFPVGEKKISHRYKAAATWPEKSHHYGLKKRSRLPHIQDTLKDESGAIKGSHGKSSVSRNDTDLWKRRRCGVPDYPGKTRGAGIGYLPAAKAHGVHHRRKRFVLFGGRWDKTDLTYKIMRMPWQMNKEQVRLVLQEALKVWSDVTPLTFTEVPSGRADIVIDFTRYWHGDNLPFDGPGGILAHAFFPRTHREGDIHFDYDETWTVGNNMGTDLLQVAAHELGHVLGLQHSLVPGSIMSPFYSFSYPLRLSEDDKRGIQYLYGARGSPERTPPPVSTETNEIEPAVPDACQTSFDAVSVIRGELFFFKSRYVWRIRDGHLQPGYPALASRHWKGIPDNIDATFEDKTGNIWFFQGKSYWVFDGERQITGPDSVHHLGLPVSDIQAALMWGEDKAQKTFFFKDGNYWRFNLQENRVDSTHPRNMHDWRGVPTQIDAAFQDKFGYAHFLSGKRYWKFDPVEVRALEGYPRYVGMDFFDCPMSLYH
ncbi:stromelysin-3 isoform X1 [Alosa sapidissima]|uniref:stromelysin-3 isoform X1 n=1 Tax=Alosa sapidissima TaxID=34773 RepID=UPI001C09222B|nr:stromelysin-3 isoform X1 [Alosa sapidissima]